MNCPPKKMAIVERRPYWRGGHIDFSGGLSVHSRQTANSYVKNHQQININI